MVTCVLSASAVTMASCKLRLCSNWGTWVISLLFESTASCPITILFSPAQAFKIWIERPFLTLPHTVFPSTAIVFRPLGAFTRKCSASSESSCVIASGVNAWKRRLNVSAHGTLCIPNFSRNHSRCVSAKTSISSNVFPLQRSVAKIRTDCDG